MSCDYFLKNILKNSIWPHLEFRQVIRSPSYAPYNTNCHLIFDDRCHLPAFACDLFSDLSILILPAVLLNGMGGISYAFTSFSVANLFGNRQSTMISLMMGSYCGSAVFYMLLKVWILLKIRVCKPRKDTQDLISSDVEFLKIVQSQLSDNLQC